MSCMNRFIHWIASMGQRERIDGMNRTNRFIHRIASMGQSDRIDTSARAHGWDEPYESIHTPDRIDGSAGTIDGSPVLLVEGAGCHRFSGESAERFGRAPGRRGRRWLPLTA